MKSKSSKTEKQIHLASHFQPKEFEEALYQEWEKQGYFHVDAQDPRPSYCIDIPPPNVTGSLHMGHALNHCLQDVLIRYKRMDGMATTWIPGTDHAGIATQSVVERNLETQGLHRKAMGREAFEKKVWEWKDQYGNRIVDQIKKMGSSCDWERERFTLDEGFSHAVRTAFVTLFKEKLIYRSSYLVNWDTVLQTAVSDLEVEYEDIEGKLYYFKYPISESNEYIEVATTRPETLLGDTAVAVHPEDERYTHLIGKTIDHPLVSRQFSIIADEHVKKEFGTGAVKITPAHDPNDYEMGARHKLESISVIGKDGKMNQNAGEFQGLDRFEARKAVVQKLEELELLQQIKPHLHAVGHSQRSGSIIEPLVSKQWFVKTKQLAKPSIEAVHSGETKFIPESWTKTYLQWMENINDWCISRQLWWGHRIPVWYCSDCQEMSCEIEDPTQCTHCGSSSLSQDPDVLDTWFSSGLWPFATLGWPEKTPELEKFFPTQVLVTAFDIIFFWVARMMMMSMKFMGKAPFSTIHIHALVRDEHGQKMSKSKGNVIDPLEMVDQYGADAFRFSLMAFSVQGRDVSISKGRIEGYRNFMNKIWNASRFAIQALPENFSPQQHPQPRTLADTWIQNQLHETVQKSRKALDQFRFNEYAECLYQFVWHEFCDWYLELAKVHLYGEDENLKNSCAQNLIYVLEEILVLMHPVCPFITELLWKTIPGNKDLPSVMLRSYPKSENIPSADPKTLLEMQGLQELITGIRTIRSENTIPPKTKLKLILGSIQTELKASDLEKHRNYLTQLANLEEISFEGKAPDNNSAIFRGDYFQAWVPLEGLIDNASEITRLEKKIEKIQKDIAFLSGKLCNEKYIKNAPLHLVERDQKKLKKSQEDLAKVEKSIQKLQS